MPDALSSMIGYGVLVVAIVAIIAIGFYFRSAMI